MLHGEPRKAERSLIATSRRREVKEGPRRDAGAGERGAGERGAASSAGEAGSVARDAIW